jgi:hypothetical protein
MKQDLVAMVKAARKAAVPLVAVATADQWAAQELLARDGFAASTPLIQWDTLRGMAGLNDAGNAQVAKLGSVPTLAPQQMLVAAMKLEKLSIVFMHNAPLFLAQPHVLQGVSNLRDAFKVDRRMLVMLGSQFQLPAPLVPDVVVVEEELPRDAQLQAILTDLHEAYEIPTPDDTATRHAIDAGRGLSAFAAETCYAMSMAGGSLDLDETWRRKIVQVNQTRGLKMERRAETFASLGGLHNACDMGRALSSGPAPIRAVVLLDEIEKAMGGASTDTSGVAQDAMGVTLAEMENNGYDGLLSVGPPGAGKTQFAKALAGELGVPLLTMDMGAMKGSLVGESQAAVREVWRVIRHVAGDGAFIIGTCNSLAVLPPELRRRFRSGIMFFDLPTRDERLAIWSVHLKAYRLAIMPAAADDLVGADGWTGAEIRNCCERAWKMSLTLERAAKWVVPVMTSDPDKVKALRDQAKGRFTSASYEGTYQGADHVPADAAPRRKRAVGVA